MIEWIDDFSAKLVGSRTFDLQIEATLPEVIERLERGVDTGMQRLLPKTSLSGRISPPSVTLHYRHVLFSNGWRPVFRGTLHEEGACVRLSGRYTLMRFTSLFIVASIAFFSVAAFAILANELVNGDAIEAVIHSAAILGMGAVFGLVHAAAIALGRTEIKEIEQRLRNCFVSSES